ncbi:MAG: PSD1 domain-containing protein [Planctomycetes bacterium]|nr:PSD1 domain-containing protein [Planctomycetota bacterium]
MRSAAVILALLACSALRAQDDHAFFESKIRPLLAERCLECHSASEAKGGLSLDSADGVRRGGASGPAIVPGEPERSRLVQAVRYRDLDLQMPPTSKLGDGEIALLEEWVRRGAPDPRTAPSGSAAPPQGVDVERARGEHWSFQPVQPSPAPTVQRTEWVRDELDRYILAELEQHGLAPAPEADRRTLLRRASFDLLGLPPEPAEIDAFLADESADAWERAVERLLASPHYGERWGRRWLDLARYADSNGLDENLALAHAWRYRDYVVRAFQQDKPYDRFVMEQLAGDLLPPASEAQAHRDQLAATGFLVLGPKMLAEQDKEKLVMDVIDEQLDVAGKAFLGLSLGCARCHDHKFDPISQRDYYALAGIFRSTSTMANLDFVSRWREVPLATPEELAAEQRWRAEEQAAREALERAERAGLSELHASIDVHRGALLAAGAALAGEALAWQAEAFAGAERLIVDREQWGSAERPILRTADGSGAQSVTYELDVPHAGSWQLWSEYASGDPRALSLAIDGALALPSCCDQRTGGYHLSDQRWELLGELELAAGAHRFHFSAPAGRPFPHLDRFALLPASAAPRESELAAATGLPRAVLAQAARVFATASADDALLAPWRALAAGGTALEELRARETLFAPYRALLADPLPRSAAELAARADVLFSTVERLAAAERAARPDRAATQAVLPDVELERVRALLEREGGPFRLSKAAARAAFSTRAREDYARCEAELARVAAAQPAPYAMALGVAEAAPVDLPIHFRGNHLSRAEQTTPRGFLELFRPLLPELAPAATRSGRLELAQWLVDPRHPLTARVMVNRIWQGHFGRGLVASSSDFGLRGEAPTHPALLDALARDFVASGWSVKALHRRILRSATYRMSSAWSELAATVDPANLKHWRFPRQRLDAETLRDAVLASSGALDRTIGGSLLGTGNGDYVTNDQSGNGAGYARPRRSLYLPIIRNAIYELFAIFDYNDPSVPIDRRGSTVVAHQALWAMNSPLVREESRRLAEALLASASAANDAQRLEQAYVRMFARPPRAEETSEALAYLAELRGAPFEEPRAWTMLVQALFASSEFLYID